MADLSNAEKNEILADFAKATPKDLEDLREMMKSLSELKQVIDGANQAVAEGALNSEARRREETLTPDQVRAAEQRNEQALQAGKGTGLTREEILALAADHRDDDMKGAAPGSLLSPELVKQFNEARESQTHLEATTAFMQEQLDKRLPPENSTVEWRVEGNNVILNITGKPSGDRVTTLPGEDAGKHPLPGAEAGMRPLPGDLAAALDIYKAGHEINNGGAYLGGNMKFAVSEHADPFKLPPAANGAPARPVQKSMTIALD
jgi:hypothetical protein